jgi:hypothetical protein
MKSDHIDNQKLSEVVKDAAVLDQTEVEHLGTCEECLEMIRLLIRQNLPRSAHP